MFIFIYLFIYLFTGLSDQIGSGRSDSLVSQCLISSSPHLISPHLSLEPRHTLSLPDLTFPRLSLQSRPTSSHIPSPLFSLISPFCHLTSHPHRLSLQLRSSSSHIPSPISSTSSHLFVTSSIRLSLQPRHTSLSPHPFAYFFNLVSPL